ncbi:MAG: transporter [Myxococcales bacterium]
MGHYTPGANASFIDMLPGRTGIAVTDAFVYRPVSASRVPIAGAVVDNLDGNVFADSLLALYRTPVELLGGNLGFGGALAVEWVDVSGTGARSGSDSGIADVLLYPFLLGWTRGDLQYDVRLGIYAPTGKYEVGSLANLGKNYWTFEPGLAVSWLSANTGLEASGFVAVDVNTRNDATDYQSGSQFHLDATLAKHFALLGGRLGAGASAFYYQQIGSDSGSGATLGAFKASSIGVGPAASYATKVDWLDLAVELKWLPEIHSDNRVEGDLFWIKVRAVF